MERFLQILLLVLILLFDVSGQGSGPSPDDYFKKAEVYRKNVEPDSALIYYEKAATEFESLGKIEELVYSYNQIGIILTRQDHYDKAKFYLQKALSVGLSSLDSNHLAIATTYISLGVISRAEGNYISL